MYINDTKEQYLHRKQCVCTFKLSYITVMIQVELNESQNSKCLRQHLFQVRGSTAGSSNDLVQMKLLLVHNIVYTQYQSDACHTRLTNSIKHSGSSETLAEYDMFKV